MAPGSAAHRRTEPAPAASTIWRPLWEPDRTDPRLPPVTLIRDRHDHRSYMTAARAAHRPELGHVTVHPTPVATAPAALAHDLLRALGKHARYPTAVPMPAADWVDNAERAWTAVAAWTHALHIIRYVICRAHLISTRHWTHLFALREQTGVHLTLLCHGPILPALAACLEAVRTYRTDEPPQAAPHAGGVTTPALWWHTQDGCPPYSDEPCLRLPARHRASPRQPASPLVLERPSSGHDEEPSPALRLAARRIHARVAHPLHAAAVATLVLTGCRPAQLTGPRPAVSISPSTQWTVPLITAAQTFQSLQGDTAQPLVLSTLDVAGVEAATTACRLAPHTEPRHAAGQRSPAARRRRQRPS
ncbi:hypothetical protein [Streptomyces rimosus]|uniref:hypothetical protein n=1 Tax=Streptomyces rimosus TaxID=1927 RepID=UPI00067B0F16|nr:hypothetical protein [Streptomyces rimosus]